MDRPTNRSRIASAVLPLAACLIAIAPALAAEWNPFLTLGTQATLSNNVQLSSDNPQTGLIFRVTPTVGISRDGARLQVKGSYSPNLIAYVPATSEGRVFNVLNGTASLEAVENFFFIDARATVSQTFTSPFGPQPDNFGNVTANRQQATWLGLSPYVRGQLPGGSRYLVRSDLSYSMFSASNQPDIFGRALLASWDGADGAFIVPSVQYNLNSVTFGSQQPFVFQTGRLRGTVNFDPEVQVFGTIGYEKNDFVVAQQEGPIYGGGFNWKPSPRTTVSASAEHRFFGWSYNFNAAYRTPLTAWAFQAGRAISSTNQQLQQLGTSGLRSTLDALLSSSIPDPVERAAAIDRFLAQSGLNTPTALYSPRILLTESLQPSFSILGNRSTITFSAFWRQTTPLSDTVAPAGTQDAFANLNTITQRGGSVGVIHNFDPMLSGSASVSRVLGVGQPTVNGTPTTNSWQTIFLVSLSRQIDPNTFGNVGFRSQSFNATSFADYREQAMFVTINHTFF